MNQLHHFILENGLRVIVQEDFSTPLVVVNTLYKVGSRDEDPSRTGFAHLFEHFMFEGSANIPEFDAPLEFSGGESNAFTTSDYTNYYNILPAQNIETALWLESDRMLSLAFEQESLNVQKRVVCEEFKEHYINQPYGDVWHKLLALAYKKHPYRWPTIGIDLSHVEDATMDSVTAFFKKYYHPNNAILSICGGIKKEAAELAVRHWFSAIPTGAKVQREWPQEDVQTEARVLEVRADVPSNAIYKAYKMGKRTDAEYIALDLLRDAIAACDTAYLYLDLVKEKRWMSSITCYLTESLDEGLFVLEGKLMEGVSIQEVDLAIQQGIKKAVEALTERELQKLKNKVETFWCFSETNLTNRAHNLAFFEMLGDANDYFCELEKYNAQTLIGVKEVATRIFQNEKSSTLYYLKTNNA
jgi:predicted Zn-dependent peptidase